MPSSDDDLGKDAKSGQSEGQMPQIPSTPAKILTPGHGSSTIVSSDELKVTSPSDPSSQIVDAGVTSPIDPPAQIVDVPPLTVTITESEEGGLGSTGPSLPTKLKLLLRGAYSRVTPSGTDLHLEGLGGPFHVQMVNNVQVTNNNNDQGYVTATSSNIGTTNGGGGSTHRTRSVDSCEEVCRICHDNGTEGNFITPCLCKGTMSLVHKTCLERWLGECGKTSCEICNYEYVTKRVPKYTGFRSVWKWIQKPVNPDDTKNLFFDVACFFILTPLASISAWLCILGSQHYAVTAQERFKESLDPAKKGHREIKEASNSTWTSIGLLTLTGTLLTAYYVWMYVAFRYHFQIWRDWQGRNFQVTVLPVSPDEVMAQNLSEGNDHHQGHRNGTATDDEPGGGSRTVAETIVDIDLDNTEKSGEGQVAGLSQSQH